MMLVPDKFLLFRQLCYAKLAHMFSRSPDREPLFVKRLLIFSFFFFFFFFEYFFMLFLFLLSNDCELCNGTLCWLPQQKEEENGWLNEWYSRRASFLYSLNLFSSAADSMNISGIFWSDSFLPSLDVAFCVRTWYFCGTFFKSCTLLGFVVQLFKILWNVAHFCKLFRLRHWVNLY